MENDEQVAEAITSDEELAIEQEPVEEVDIDTLKAQVEEKDTFARQANARAIRAEKELKSLKATSTTPQAPQNIEETVLLATGMPEELVKELKVVAQVRGISMVKAQNDPIFVSLKDNFEKNQKKDEASLPASRGSATTKPKRDFTSPGLTREEHMEMVSKMQ